jgi:cyclic pyranopterin phosphate synthase
MEGGFTHFDENGSAVMVDVGSKDITEREALASGVIRMSPETLRMILDGKAKKGDVLGVARIAGIMAAKRTFELIPLCHPVLTEHLSIDFFPNEQKSLIEARMSAKLSGKTGLEMEALTGVSVALLTIYDMCKAVDRAMEIGNIRLLMKSGGKSGLFLREGTDV